MTLIIGLACKDGVIIASDGQATSGSSGGPVRRPLSKIQRLGNNKLWGASGSVGLIQRVTEALESISPEILNYSLKEPELRQAILREIYQVRKAELERHRGLYGPGCDREAQVADSIFVEYQNGCPVIWHVMPDCQDVREEEFGYGCSGSGDIFAHTILKNYNVHELPIKQASLVAYRVIRDAIDVGAYGLGEPIDIWVIDDNGIRQKSEEEMLALRDAYSSWMEAEEETFKKFFVGTKGKQEGKSTSER